MLKILGATDVIQNITLMGGATDFKLKKEEQWAELFA